MEGKFKVSCFGAGFVGLPTTSVLALKNPNCDVKLVLFSLWFSTLTKRRSRCAVKAKCQSLNLNWSKLSQKFIKKI